MKTGTLVIPPEHNPVRESLRFEGWTLDGQPYDFQMPILQDLTLTAKWAKTTDWTLSPNHGPATGAQLTISPPDKQEPYYTSIHAAGDQIVGLTGDGRIYTWTQDSTPKQVPFPAQAADGFHYLQAAAGSHRQAALGSDHHIYTWTNQQPTPTILDTSQNTQFTSLSMNDDRLLAVDQQGQVHTFQVSQSETQDPTAKPGEQAATSLPGSAQVVTALASTSRILIVDANGQTWIWDANTIGKAQPARIKQDSGIRIVQAQALSKGFLLVDSNGQARYLADGKTSMTMVSLPDGGNASRITANKDQAVITDTDGHVWSWEPGNRPVRADNGNQPYTQATETGNRITALDGQGGMSMWSLDAQDKPIRLNTTQAPILETASMDGQPMKLSKEDGSWQIKAPAHKPGQATITIIGKQDGQPFTRNLKYTVDQKLTRDTQTGTTYTVSFDTAGGSQAPDLQQIPYPYGRAQRPSPDPTRKGYLFDGWFIGEVAYDFSKPVTENLTLTAKWTRQDPDNTWRINPNKGSQVGGQQTTITPPNTRRGIRFSQVSGGKDYFEGFSLAVGSDGNAYAWGNNEYGRLGDETTTTRTTPVMVKKPDRKTYPDVPADFTYVQVSAGASHSLALGSDGYVYAWGANGSGQLGNNTTMDSSVPVRVRDPSSPDDASQGLQAMQVSAGGWHSLAVGKDGNAYAWGSGSDGRLGNNSSSNSAFPVRVRDPASSYDASQGLKATRVSAGYSHSLAIGINGYAYSWGDNNYGQLGNNTRGYSAGSFVPVRVRDPSSPTDTSKGLQATQVSTGEHYSLAVGSNGYAYAWGDNEYGQLGNNSTNNSTIPALVRDPADPTNTSQGLKAVQVSTGYSHSLAVGSNGYAYAWGDNQYGQLGNNSTNNSTVPALVRDP
ncbi:InlB B-repeat-containing protein, partial [Bifidobacterium sp. wkB344]|uniref:RCC1 domain-containing protein n=1 Tax=Bifidobacterium sp. wkB344 TaxID=2025113 RepID=UPI00217D7EAD